MELVQIRPRKNDAVPIDNQKPCVPRHCFSAHHRVRLEGANQSDYSAAAAVCFFAFDLEGSLRALLTEAFFRCKYALRRLRLALTRCCCPIERFYRSEQSGAQSGFGSKTHFHGDTDRLDSGSVRLANKRRGRALFIADASKDRGG